MDTVIQEPAKKQRNPADEALKTRRERNRKAQDVFRKRRQAAEEAQRRRLQHLEEVVEEMSGVLVGFCDEMLENEEIARHPALMASLQRSAHRILALARSVDTDGVSKSSEADTINHEDQIPQRGSSSIKEPLPGHVHSSVPQASPSFDVEIDNMDNHLSDKTAPLNQRPLSPQTQHLLWAMNPFPLRLVETTLSRAYLFLNGDLHVPIEEIHRAFGTVLHLRTREQLAARMQWLLGPGRSDMYRAAGITQGSSTAHSSGTEALEEGFPHTFLSSLGDRISRGPSDADLVPGYPGNQAAQPEFLTAVGVQKQLEGLGAKMIDPDTMEISISSSSALSGSGVDKPDVALGAPPLLHSPRPKASAPLIMRLSVSLLTTNLAHVAVCLGKGPRYPRWEMGRAVQASVTLVRGGEGVARQ
ncbi:hypothetical protein QBC33DRAFT_551199 [Phialemonium atrogriseum]|uniref:BZIP domain-containing protein n=1 Tax=Phialemonium atrogriseum TaxID=1093897 RepID=A0AAJ0BRR6_9PEZI|nr:uncharacterized protein QBC33DRAFT_551199 [Phialemonium atrogriseum]KAK1762842.1 hypothetical protein QBC33DRAFT_551199 [Phialemonium atrogriseum]